LPQSQHRTGHSDDRGDTGVRIPPKALPGQVHPDEGAVQRGGRPKVGPASEATKPNCLPRSPAPLAALVDAPPVGLSLLTVKRQDEREMTVTSAARP
jgi:hypothetical protein